MLNYIAHTKTRENAKRTINATIKGFSYSQNGETVEYAISTEDGIANLDVAEQLKGAKFDPNALTALLAASRRVKHLAEITLHNLNGEFFIAVNPIMNLASVRIENEEKTAWDSQVITKVGAIIEEEFSNAVKASKTAHKEGQLITTTNFCSVIGEGGMAKIDSSLYQSPSL